ncbi:MAG: DegT/DnrJ/EryC1/StrS family aminotransferase [Armatimonadetes bacterium]|nr:DegT/DnrJ/EryC1/StrS family aminotransferase [Armatimonadota bacterium]
MSGASDLAINGGKPVRTEPFPPWPYFWQEEKDAVMAVLDSNDVNYHRGMKGIQFEEAWAEYHGVQYAVAVCNGGAALQCACYAAGLGPGDEVIVPAHTYQASDLAALWVNAIPVFADMDPGSLNMSVDDIAAKITPRTRAIVVVHIYGRPADLDEIMALAEEHDLMVIEDCAQAHGATYKGRKVGSIGHLGAFSFCQTKHITTGGEGGMVTTDDPELAVGVRAAKDYGVRYDRRREDGRWLGGERYGLGWNLRMTEMQAAMGLVLLDKLDDYVAKRRELAEYLTRGLEDCPALTVVPEGDDRTHTYFRYDTLFNPEAVSCTRNEFIAAVQAEGVPCAAGSNPTNHLDPLFADQLMSGGQGPMRGFPWCDAEPRYRPGECPVAEEVGQRIVCLEVYPTIEISDCDDTLAAIYKVTDAFAK